MPHRQVGTKAKLIFTALKALQLEERRSGKTRKTRRKGYELAAELAAMEAEEFELRARACTF